MRLAVRIDRLADRPPMNIIDLVRVGTNHMIKLEGRLPNLDVALVRREISSQDFTIVPPYSARRLWETSELSAWATWGHVVEALWTVMMSLDAPCPEWHTATSKMLLWRAIVGENQSPGEWVRKEVVHTLVN